jgi:hypothetical protein
MSRPPPRMGYSRLQKVHAAEHAAAHVLCPNCGPSGGYGWEVSYEEYSWKKEGSLPPAVNGYSVTGICKYCEGTGFTPIPLAEFCEDEQ